MAKTKQYGIYYPGPEMENKSADVIAEMKKTAESTDASLSKKVDAEEGMGLSANSFEDVEKQKLAGIEEGATKIFVDTELSETSSNPVENRAIAKQFNIVQQYVDKTIQDSLENISGLTPKIVAQLPEEGNANTIYLVLDEEAKENNVYKEYLYINGQYELFGNTSNMSIDIDLSEYAKKDEIPLIYYVNKPNDTEQNLIIFQEVVDKHFEGKDIIIVVLFNGKASIFYFYSTLLSSNRNFDLRANQYTAMSYQSSAGTISLEEFIPRISITIDDNNMVTKAQLLQGSLQCTVVSTSLLNNDNYFTPKYNSQPVSLGFLKDVIGNINSIIDYINGEVIDDVSMEIDSLMKEDLMKEEPMKEEVIMLCQRVAN